MRENSGRDGGIEQPYWEPSNVTSVVEYSKFVTAQQLGDRIVHIINIFFENHASFTNIIVSQI